MVYETKCCPYCGKYITLHEPKSSKQKYGNPFRRCLNCQKEYIDSSIREIEVDGMPFMDKYYILGKGAVVLGVVLLFYLLVSHDSGKGAYILLYLMYLLLAIPKTISLINNKNEIEQERIRSRNRLNDCLYAQKLSKAGRKVPAQYLKQGDKLEYFYRDNAGIVDNRWQIEKGFLYLNEKTGLNGFLFTCLKDEYKNAFASKKENVYNYIFNKNVVPSFDRNVFLIIAITDGNSIELTSYVDQKAKGFVDSDMLQLFGRYYYICFEQERHTFDEAVQKLVINMTDEKMEHIREKMKNEYYGAS